MKPFLIAISLAALALPSLLSSCDGYEEQESPSAEACEHTQAGPSNAVAAAAVADTTAGDVSAAHTRHDVTLVAGNGGNSGFVRFDSVGGATTIFSSADLAIAATNGNGTSIALSAAGESECTEVVKSFSGDMPVGLVFLRLGPTDATNVSLVVEADNAPEEDE